MPGIHRLSSTEFRAWRENVPQLVGKGGRILRAVEAPEEEALFPIVQRAKKMRDSIHCRMSYPADGRKGSTGPRVARVVKVEVRRLGPQPEQFAIDVFIDGARYVTGREILSARMLARYGEVTLKRPNNTFLKVLRDPTLARPTYEESNNRSTPFPANCECKNWGEPHPGRHHRVCPENSKSPPHERALEPNAPVRETAIDLLPSLAPERSGRNGALAGTAAAVTRTQSAPVPPAKKIFPPTECPNGCAAWALPRGYRQEEGQHNPICEWFEPYKARSVLEEPMFIVDLDTGERVRRATVDEAARASVAHKKNGASLLEIGGHTYAVLPSETGIDAQRRLDSERQAKARYDQRVQKPTAKVPVAVAEITLTDQREVYARQEQRAQEANDVRAEENSIGLDSIGNPNHHGGVTSALDGSDDVSSESFASDMVVDEKGEVSFTISPPEDPDPNLEPELDLPSAEDILNEPDPALRTTTNHIPERIPVREGDQRAVVHPTSDEELDAGVLARFAPPDSAMVVPDILPDGPPPAKPKAAAPSARRR